MGKLLEELKRRKVFRVAAVYAVVAWVLIQVADVVLPTFGAPGWVNQTIIFLFILGFFPTLIAAWAYEVTPEGVKPDPGIQNQIPAPQSQRLIYATFFLVLLAVGFQISERFFAGDSSTANRFAESALAAANRSVMRSSIILNRPLGRNMAVGLRTVLSIAPDGSALAYADIETEDWFVRNMATQETQVLAGNAAGRFEFSPDSQRLLLFLNSDRVTNIMPTQGGSLQPLPIESIRPPAWISDEDIIYVHEGGDTRVFSLADRTEEIISGFDATNMDGSFVELPSETAFLYSPTRPSGPSNRSEIYAYNLINGTATLVTSDGYYPKFANSDHVLFLRAGDLWAVPFDSDTLEVTGAEARVLEGVDSVPGYNVGAYAVSESGRFVYLPGSEFVANRSVIYWADRLGNREKIPLPTGLYNEPRLSPNGELLALASYQADGSSNIWVYDFLRETFNPITFAGNARNPVWTPDGSRLVYQSGSDNSSNSPRGALWIMNADGTGQAERILDAEVKADAFSPIDEKLIYMTGGANSGTPVNLDTLTLSDDAWVSAPLFRAERNIFGARVSPDGRWIAYGSAESGNIQIYVQPYPNLDSGKWQISTGEIGHREPSWGPNGDELFFLRLDGTLMHTDLEIEGDRFSSGIVGSLVSGLDINGAISPNYLVSNDGERFLHFYRQDVEPSTGIDQDHAELVVIENFFEELKRLAPPFPQ